MASLEIALIVGLAVFGVIFFVAYIGCACDGQCNYSAEDREEMRRQRWEAEQPSVGRSLAEARRER